MGRLWPLTAVALALALACAAPASAGSTDTRLSSVRSWAFAIGDRALSGDLAKRYAGYGLVVVDGEEVSRRQVRRLRATGAVVLAYLSVGTIEPGRSWYRKARRHRLDLWGDWGEWYADTSSRRYRNLIARDVAPKILAKGVDGLFLDNVDMIETHRRQRRGMRALVARLSKGVRARGGFLFTQNGAAVIGPMVRYLDGWNREDLVFGYDFDRRRYVRNGVRTTAAAQAELRAMGDRGLLTLATSYTAGSPALRTEAMIAACAAGALPFVSNIGLTRVGSPLVCAFPPD